MESPTPTLSSREGGRIYGGRKRELHIRLTRAEPDFANIDTINYNLL
jgi:hypothetical protein